MPRVATALALLCVVGSMLLGGCSRCESKVDFESFVSVPTDLDAVEELDDPPDVIVKIEKKAAPKGGGGGCGHSPICIIIIPFAIADALFPEKLRIATVTEKGRETYHGVFRENGQFVQALAFQDGVWKKIALVQLAALGRNIVVEVERAPADAEGKPGTFVKSSLQKQVDLVSGYRAAFAATTDPTRRGLLLQEMLSNVREDSLPLAKERLLDSAESSAVRQNGLAILCSEKGPVGSAEERARLLAELDKTNPDLGVTVAALACFDPKEPASASAYTARVVDAACAAKDSYKATAIAENLVRWASEENAPPMRKSVEPVIARCVATERRQLVRFALGFELETRELGELASSKDRGTSGYVIDRLDHTNPAHRAILLAELERPDSPLKSLLLNLRQHGSKPDAEEAKALAGAYIVRSKSAEDRAEIAMRLDFTPEDQRGPAKARLQQKLVGQSGEERSALAAALVMLGEREQEAAAARALVGFCPKLAEVRAQPGADAAPPPSDAGRAPEKSPLERAEVECSKKLAEYYFQVRDTPTLVAFVLQTKACDLPELLALAASSAKDKAPERGRVCKGNTAE